MTHVIIFDDVMEYFATWTNYVKVEGWMGLKVWMKICENNAKATYIAISNSDCAYT
jgi:hypothetical protein